MKSTYAKNKQLEAPRVSTGFTIIELLIVIVIIGVLVAITAVSFSGVTRSANEAAAQSELKQARATLELNKAKTGIYPTSLSSNTPPISQPKNTTLTYTQLDGGQDFTLTATSNSMPDIVFVTSSSAGIAKPSPNIQTITKAICPTELTQVKDARDNNSYYIKKLADNQCWMLTNLAYAGGISNSGTNTYNDTVSLINGSTDTSNTYTDPKYYISPSANPTIDPTPPSTATDGGVNTSTRQFGYLYNWCAAMGGQNTAACATATTPTPIPTTNICPAGWRLPTGGPGGEFATLNTAINGGLTNTDAGLLSNGLFQRSGYWGSGFGNQGSAGRYWSSTQNHETYAHYLYFNSTNVDPPYSSSKNGGRTVRCVAQ